MKVKVKSLSCVQLFATPWTIAYQAPPSMGFSRQECWSGLPFPSPGDLPDPGIEPRSPALQADALPCEPPGKPISWLRDEHKQEVPEINQIWPQEQTNQNDWLKETQKKCPHKSDLNYFEGSTLSLSESAHMFIHIYYTLFFPPHKYFTFTAFFVGILFLQSPRGQGLVTDH